MIWHVTLAREGRFPLSHTLAIVATIVRVCGELLLLFAVVDEHLHLVVIGERFAVGRRISGLVRALDAPLEPARVRPVADRAHLRRLIGYVAGQPRHHGAGSWAGTCLPDLIDARRIGFDPGRLSAQLPRESLGALALEGAGFGVSAIAPAGDALVRTQGAVRGYHAALAAAGLAERAGRTPLRVAVDRGWRHLAEEAGLRDARDAAAISLRTWQRLAGEPVDAAWVQTIRRSVAFEVATPRAPLQRG